MSIRIEYRPADMTYQEFHSLDSECFPGEPIRKDDFDRYLDGDFWAAYDDHDLVGFCLVIRKPDFAWLSRIGVAGTFRGRGIGTGLMKDALEFCSSEGFSRVVLYVESTNAGAIRLYRSFGFRIIEDACQYVLRNPLKFSGEKGHRLAAVPLKDVPEENRPELPGEWKDLESMHCPPQQYSLVFIDEDSGFAAGYCRLNPGFPGCFPFTLLHPESYLVPAVEALKPYLDPAADVLKLTFSSEKLDSACSEHGMELNYRLHKMMKMNEMA
jgi:GNAT superfamily N-acetyltransferase